MQQLIGQFLRFCIIGAVNTGIDFAIYFGLTRYTILGSTDALIVVALCIAFGIANVNAFFLHRRFTFTDHKAVFTERYVKYLTVSLIGLGVNTAVFSTALFVFDLNDIYAKIIAIFVVLWVSFTGNKLWAFKA